MIDLKRIHDVLDVLVACTNLIGVPVAIVIFTLAKQRERLDRENGTYATLNQQYVDFLRLAFDNPQLPIYGQAPEELSLTKDENQQVECAFLILISLIESAYLLYRQHSDALRAAQWNGWQSYILDYFENPVFRRMWPDLGRQFDQGFFIYVSNLVKQRDASR